MKTGKTIHVSIVLTWMALLLPVSIGFAGEWYGGMKHSSAGAWNQMKKGFSDAYQSLYDSWKKATDEFKSDKAGKNRI